MTTKIRALPILFLLAITASTVFVACSTIEAHAAPVARCRTVTCAHGGRIQPKPCKQNVACLKRALRWSRHDRRHLRHELGVRVHRDASYAIHLASAAFGVSEQNMRIIAQCESGLGAQTTAESGSGASGVFQFLGSTWRHTPFANFDVFDPVANSLAAAWLVTKDGSWREWSCSSITGVR